MPFSSLPAYEKIARSIEQQIAQGTLRSRDRIPSVREMSRAAGVSASTVVQAYLRLEAAGVIEARPKSGFYVKSADIKHLPQPRPLPLRSTRPRSVAGEVLDTCIEAMRRADTLLPLGEAEMASHFFPNRRLTRLTRQALKDNPSQAGQHAHSLVVGIGRLPGAEIVWEPRVNQGLVRFLDSRASASPYDHDRRTDDIIARINAGGGAFFSGTTWQGRRAMRISVCNWQTSHDDVARAIDAVAEALRYE
jgi:DNA-binding transcriptional regulator YhcF (GntR family)